VAHHDAGKTRVDDADDGHWHTRDGHGGLQHAWITVELTLPVRLAHDGHRRCVRPVIVRRQQASGDGFDTETGEVVPGHELGDDGVRGVSGIRSQNLPAAEKRWRRAGEVREDRVAFAVSRVVVSAEEIQRRIARVLPDELDELVRVTDGKVAEEQVDEAEDRGRGADRETERHHDDHGEQRRASNRAPPMPEIAAGVDQPGGHTLVGRRHDWQASILVY
jgi:hypothetical protein